MSLAAYKTWSSGEVLTASDLNASFTNILNNANSLISPSTANIAMGGYKLTGLGVGSADGDSVRYEQLPFSVCDFRLTLTSGTPVTTSDVTGATTIYASPYKGNSIGLYDGTNWHVRTSAEFSLALGTLTSGKPYDVFCYDNAGTPTLEFLVWTNDTTRATALTLQNGVLCKTGALTRRYLGTFYTTSTTQTEDSKANRYLFNYYNRAARPMSVYEATNSWNYTTATVRQANGAAGNQLNMMIGYNEDLVDARVYASANNTNAGVGALVSIGVDSTTTPSADCITSQVFSPAANYIFALTAFYRGFVGVGKHSLVWQEFSVATGTTAWIGDNNTSTFYNSGITGTVMA